MSRPTHPSLQPTARHRTLPLPSTKALRVAIFGQSLISDWNHGNAHFLRGLVRSLQTLGHQVTFSEDAENWSLANLRATQGEAAVAEFAHAFPMMQPIMYQNGDATTLRPWLEGVLDEADVALVHEWNTPDLIRLVGQLGRQRHDLVTLFHDTHYRVYSEPETMRALELENYRAILAFGPEIARIYREDFGHPHVYTFHEAADADLFCPRANPRTQDVVFIGNWGDRDRNEQIEQYLFTPARRLPERRFVLYGVRYDDDVQATIREAGIEYRGWMPNHRTPEVYAASRMSLHIPRQQYVRALHGTPTIRMFEVLSCGLPLVSLPWEDSDHLFTAGEDYLVVRDQQEMIDTIELLCRDEALRQRLGAQARATILARHTCLHRTRQLLQIVDEVRG
jgi:spore maturation protein CgeB